MTYGTRQTEQREQSRDETRHRGERERRNGKTKDNRKKRRDGAHETVNTEHEETYDG